MRFTLPPSQSDQLLIRSGQQRQQLQPIQQVSQITYYQFPEMEPFERHLSDLGPFENIIAFIKKPTVILRLTAAVSFLHLIFFVR